MPAGAGTGIALLALAALGIAAGRKKNGGARQFDLEFGQLGSVDDPAVVALDEMQPVRIKVPVGDTEDVRLQWSFAAAGRQDEPFEARVSPGDGYRTVTITPLDTGIYTGTFNVEIFDEMQQRPTDGAFLRVDVNIV